ncbi:helix-turn-helix domain-containing protein [Pseudomonas sp. 6D_7.1_Bac1]|uniref:helix-turn-helix domain-containing protein n=1 Tax=Pseudomonas sp. 6D_7.1_Bac1 TaxID=2971615 RepID=UPI0021CAB5C2|nr:helix-turn-helix domain-containing protein [Pseudomonas sp. 6D_7.1_Bac1]MCU1750251.1 helix-turn-helix domain-containing protein [Pseudomonas sp. 6D_7.1_Bac1]
MNNIHLSGFNCGNEKSVNASIRYLYAWIKKNGAKKTVNPGEELLETDENSIFSIESGAWRLLVGDQKVISIIGPGGIVLLDHQPQYHNVPSSRYEVVSCSTYYEFPMEGIHLAASDKELLKGLFDFMTWSACDISNKWLMQCLGDSYTEVKSALEWMNALPEAIRSKFTAIAFITDTTGVSRSHALSIMKSLKQGGYIEMDGGHLINIIKKLPDGY